MAIKVEMDEKMFESLCVCNPALAWRLVARDALAELTGISQLAGGDEAIPVPFLWETYTYDVMHMVIKEGGSVFPRFMKKPTMRVIGHLEDYLTLSEQKNINHLYSVEQAGTYYNQVFQFSVSRSVKDHFREISLQIKGSHRRSAVLGADSFHINKDGSDLENTKKVYLVKDAFCVTMLRMFVTVDGHEMITVREGEHIPIGFTLDKFRLSRDGTLTPAFKKAALQAVPWSTTKLKYVSEWRPRFILRGKDDGAQSCTKQALTRGELEESEDSEESDEPEEYEESERLEEPESAE